MNLPVSATFLASDQYVVFSLLNLFCNRGNALALYKKPSIFTNQINSLHVASEQGSFTELILFCHFFTNHYFYFSIRGIRGISCMSLLWMCLSSWSQWFITVHLVILSCVTYVYRQLIWTFFSCRNMASLNETSQLSSTTCSDDSFDTVKILSAQQLRHLESAILGFLEEDGTPGCLNPSVFGAEGDRSIGDMLEDSLGVD